MNAFDPGKTIAGRYVIEREIGRGGMGAVYRVEHINTGEKLALKILLNGARFDPRALVRFKREARAATQIKSEHVVRVTDADTATELDGLPFIVMELLDGVDLDKHLERNGALTPDQLIAVLAQISRALESAHRQGIVHRDLKPENLFLHRRDDGSTIAKVLDFGISKFGGPEAGRSVAGVTGTGAIIGTPIYMSPEQAHARNDEVGPATDVWSLGLVAMRLLTNEHYWGDPTLPELMLKLTVEAMVAPSLRWPNDARMSAALDAWFLRSCSREREKRFASVTVQVEELALALSVSVPPAGTPLPFRDVAPPSKLARDGFVLADTEEAKQETLPQEDGSPKAAASGGTKRSETPGAGLAAASDEALVRSAVTASTSKALPWPTIGVVGAAVVAAALLYGLRTDTKGGGSTVATTSPSVTITAAPSTPLSSAVDRAVLAVPSAPSLSSLVPSASAPAAPKPVHAPVLRRDAGPAPKASARNPLDDQR